MPTAAAVRRFNHYARAIQEIHITWQDGQRFLSAPWAQARAAMDAPDTRPLLWRLTRIHFDGLPGPAIRTVLPLVPRAVTYLDVSVSHTTLGQYNQDIRLAAQDGLSSIVTEVQPQVTFCCDTLTNLSTLLLFRDRT